MLLIGVSFNVRSVNRVRSYKQAYMGRTWLVSSLRECRVVFQRSLKIFVLKERNYGQLSSFSVIILTIPIYLS